MSNVTQTVKQAREQAIREHFPMPEDVARHANTANYDLYFGPYNPDHWQEEEDDEKQPLYSFSDSLDVFAEWVQELGTVYYSPDCGTISETEPVGSFWREDPDTGEIEYTEYPDLVDCNALDEEGVEWQYAEPEEYYEIDAKAIAEAYGYATLLTYV